MAKRGKRTAAGKAKNGEADENGAAEPVEETPAKLAKVEDTESGSEHVVSETKPAKKSFGDTVKLLAWNVAGLRGWAKKDGPQEVKKFDADILFLGETKCKEIPVELEKYFKGYEKYMAVSSEKNGGYAGVALMSKVKPIKVSYGIGKPDFDKEGRLIIAEFDKFYLVGVYVPNSGRGLVNLSRRGKWDDLFIAKLKELDAEKPVILTGDLNVAHEEIDLANPKSNHNKTAGFTDAEREKFTELLGQGFVDVYRKRNPELKGAYTFWSYMGGARAKNVGWRLDYFVTSERLYEKVTECTIHSETLGSDHCPLSMTFEH